MGRAKETKFIHSEIAVTQAVRLCSLVFVCCLALVHPTIASGEDAYSISYSGRLTQANGAPIEGPVDVEVQFFRNATGGTSLIDSITKQGLTLTNGVFSLELSLSSAELRTVFEDGTRPVYIEIIAAGKTYPRQKYVYAPLALRIPINDKQLAFDDTTGKLGLKMDASATEGSVLTIGSGGGISWKKFEAANLVAKDSTGASPTTNQVLIYKDGSWVAGAVPSVASTQASGSSFGYLSSADWNTFNAKQSALGFSPVNKAGDTLSGPLDMGGQVVTGLATPSATSNAATKGYVDGLVLRKDGTTQLTGAWNVGAQNITNTGDLIMAGSKVLGLSTNPSDPALSGVGDKGKVWFNSSSNELKYWDGSSARVLGVAGAGIQSLVAGSGVSVSGSGTSPTVALSSVGTSGTYSKVTTDSFGRVTAGTSLTASDLPDTSVTPGTYTRATITVDQQGRLTAASSGAAIADADIDSAAGIAQSKISGLTDDLAVINASLSAKEPAIAGGSAGQYWNGNKTWQTLNTTVVPEGTNQYFTNARAISALTGIAPINYGIMSGEISISQAGGTSNGYLSSTDWTTFNSKQAALSYTPVNKAGDTITGSLDLASNNVVAAGNIQLSAAKTLGLGVYTADPTGLTAADKGKIWFNATSNQIKFWDGSAAVATLTPTDIPVAPGSSGNVLTSNGTTWQSAALPATNWASPGSIGSTAPNTGKFTELSSSETRLSELAANGNNYVGFKAPDALSANKVWVLPSSDGTAGQVLKTDGAGNLGWVSDGGGTVTAVTATGPLSIVNGTTTPALSVSQANGSTSGYLTASDWNTFNAKQAPGNYVTALTGDITTSGFNAGSVTATLASVSLAGTSTKVTYDVKGRINSGTTLDATDLPPHSAALITSGTLAIANGGTGLSSIPSNGQIPIGNGTGYSLANLSAGPGISITNSAGAVTVNATYDPATKVSKQGDTMTGTLTLPTNGLVAGTDQLVVAGSGVGIGTTSPLYKLQLNTAAQTIDGVAVVGSDGHYATFRASAGISSNNNLVQTGDSGIVYTGGSMGTGAFTITPWASATSGIRMDSNGNVGIGNPFPSAKLDAKSVATNGSAPAAVLASSTITMNSSGTFWGTGIETVINPAISSGVTNAGDMYALVARAYRNSSSDTGTLGGEYGAWIGYGHNDATARVTNHAHGIFIWPNHAGGTINNDFGILIGNANGTVMPTNYYGLYQQDTAAKNYFAGNVGIGTTAPPSLLSLNGLNSKITLMPSDGGAWFELWNDEVNDSLRLAHSSGNGITVKNTGNIGIGSTSPAATLDVVGTGKISGGLGDIIYSTQPANRYYASGTGWRYTGEYLTISVPAGPARRYRITNRQMVIQASAGNVIMALSTSSTSESPSPYYPYQSVVAAAWSTVNADTYVTLNGGTTTTYYVWVFFSSSGGAVANENRAFCDLFAVQM